VSANQLSILVVDDEHSMRRLIIGMLRSLGNIDFIEAPDGSGALQRLHLDRTCRPDLAIVDLHMEPMNGVQFGREVRSGERPELDRFMPLILITGDQSREAITSALACGFDDILPKPCPPNLIVERTKRLLFSERPFTHVRGIDAHGGDYFGPVTKWVRETIIPGREHKLHTRPPILRPSTKSEPSGGVSWLQRA